MMGEMMIRPFRPEDAEDLLLIANAPGVRWGTTEVGALTIMEQRQRLEALATTRDRYALGAAVGGHIVGMVNLDLGAHPRTRHSGVIAIAVRDDYQGRGIGTALMTAILDLADNWLNVHRVDLEVNADNEAAIHVYEKFGFVREGVKRDAKFRAGRFIDCLIMARIRLEQRVISGP